MKVHMDVTADRVIEAVERSQTSLDNPGFCIACGAAAEGVEPDARKYQCEACDEQGVYGAEELLMHLAFGGVFSTVGSDRGNGNATDHKPGLTTRNRNHEERRD